MSILDNKVAYGILPGNHDMAPGGGVPKYENHFPASRYEGYSYWGESYNHNKNNYQLFSAGGMDFIALNLEYCPPDHVLDWADNVLDNYPNRRAIISTHSYLDVNGNRYDDCSGNSEGSNGGTSIWDNLVVPHNNVFLVLCGHVGPEAKRSDVEDNRTVHQLLSNYQGRSNGGNGWLRIMKFVPNEDKIYVRTYSSYLDQYETDSNSQFELTYPMEATAAGGLAVSTLGAENVGYTSADLKGGLENLGGAISADVWFQWRESGTSTWENTSKQTLGTPQEFSESLSGLSEGTTYEFQAVADNSTDVDYGSILTFKTLTHVSWWNSDWLYRKEIMIDQTKVDCNLDNFPILIDIVDPDLKAHAMDNGDDILFTSSDGETKIPHEIELYDNSNGHLVAHVRVPYLSAVENTSIFMYYGNPEASNRENATGVWNDNHVMVQHMADNTTSTTEDSTSNNNDGTKKGANEPIEADGKIGKGQDFDGIDDYINCGNKASLNITNAITIEAWAKKPSFPASQTIVTKQFDTKYVYQFYTVSGSKLRFFHRNAANQWEKKDSTDTLSVDTWHFVAVTISGNTLRFYVDGAEDSGNPQTLSYSRSSNDGNVRIGSLVDAQFFNGIIDEVRISNTVRSACWISTTFNNENSPDTFYSVGSEEIVRLAVSTLGAENVGYTSADLKGDLENLGGAGSAEVWFQWRESGTPSWENTSKENLYGPQEFSESLSGLSEGTTYEFRAVADNSTDMDYGSILTFQTLTHVSWWNSDWSYRKEITIDNTKVDCDLDNFPILIDITDPDLKAHAMDNGDDILFTKSDGETKIPHEIELYENSNGHLVAHVRVPYLSAGENTIIFMYYGNPGASNQENPVGVWDDNYVMVQHLEEPSGTIYDSTSYGNDGTTSGNPTYGASGQIDGAIGFDGTDDHINCGNKASLNITNAITIGAWVKKPSFPASQTIVTKRFDTKYVYQFYTVLGSKLRFFHRNAANQAESKDSTDTLSVDTWHFVAVTISGNSLRFYVDGAEDSGNPQTLSYSRSSNDGNVGIGSSVDSQFFNGIIDEVRISNTVRSACWMSTTFNNENSPDTFYSVGSEEAIVRGVEVLIEPDNQPGVIGENVVFTVTVKNTGNIWENYKLENNDDAGWTLKLDNDYLEIPKNENRETKLTVFVPDNENLICTTDNITVVATAVDNAEVTDNDNATVHAVPSWTGSAVFSLVNLYTVNVEKILDLNEGSKLVVKLYTYGDAFENENVIENFTTPPTWHVEENEHARHPEDIGVQKARLDLTTDDTENVISTIASFIVRKGDLEIRFSDIPFEWALAPTEEERSALETEFSDIPFYWALAPD